LPKAAYLSNIPKTKKATYADYLLFLIDQNEAGTFSYFVAEFLISSKGLATD
jgi:hypothetical protein